MRNLGECVSELGNRRGVFAHTVESWFRKQIRSPSEALKRFPLAALSFVLILLIVTRNTGFANDKKTDPEEIGRYCEITGITPPRLPGRPSAVQSIVAIVAFG